MFCVRTSEFLASSPRLRLPRLFAVHRGSNFPCPRLYNLACTPCSLCPFPVPDDLKGRLFWLPLPTLHCQDDEDEEVTQIQLEEMRGAARVRSMYAIRLQVTGYA